ncbi:MAG TPA: TIGR00730 family Rossman fold protein, partial [Kofleriaceae bacterium]|nr:TIGR00730 family Rossman fold protein [Kofleriaceae bacterium]
RGLSALHVVESMAARKRMMFELADAFVTLPGGFGTLDELFEALTASLLGHHAKPVVLVDVDGYYRKLVEFVDGAVEAGLLRPQHRALLRVVGDVESALEAVAPAPAPAPAPA